MIYIPNDWLENKENMEAVYQILESEFFSELNLSERVNRAAQRLREIGENRIAEKLKSGEIIMPC